MRGAFLKDCLVEGAAEAQGRRRSTRRKTLIAALLFEGAIVVGMVLWPLLSSGSPPPKFVVLEQTLYPYRSQPIRRAARSSSSRSAIRVPNYSPPRIVAQTVHPVRDEVPVIGNPNIGTPSGESALTEILGGVSPAYRRACARAASCARNPQE